MRKRATAFNAFAYSWLSIHFRFILLFIFHSLSLSLYLYFTPFLSIYLLKASIRIFRHNKKIFSLQLLTLQSFDAVVFFLSLSLSLLFANYLNWRRLYKWNSFHIKYSNQFFQPNISDWYILFDSCNFFFRSWTEIIWMRE